MKYKFLKLSLLLVVLLSLGLVSYRIFDDKRKNQLILQLVVQSLNQEHFTSKDVNDTFSAQVYKLYLERLDHGKRFLTEEDVTQLKKYELLLDDQLKVGSFDFLELSYSLLVKRIPEVEGYYKDILSKPFDFKVTETYQTDSEKSPFAKNSPELKEVWRKYLKYEVLTRVSAELEVQEKLAARPDSIKAKDTTKTKTFEQIEIAARKKTLEGMDNYFKALKKLTLEDWRWRYVNSITGIYDPHTEYFCPKEKENFDIAISGKLEGIGATLSEQEGSVKVMEIMIGSPSWKQGHLKAGDLILKVAQGTQEPVSIVGMRLDDAVRLIRGKKGTEVRLTVKKADGTIEIISIIRDVINFEETFAKSAVLKEKDDKKFGYIYLPQFYVDFNDPNGRRCSEDVKKELDKLKKDNINGLILDLRNNGGGSLQDVVKMAGYFINKGPIVQVKARRYEPRMLEDDDNSVYYDGNLVILINEFSASASEIMAAAMQDYKRAVIVGSQSFGKGTVQTVMNFDDYSVDNSFKPLGSLKLTIQKFYRINGGATQVRGVVPDIQIPDVYMNMDMGEKSLDYVLPWDEIKKSTYTEYSKAPNYLDLRAKSSQRISKNPTFKLIAESAQRMKANKDETIVDLNLKTYREKLKKQQEETKKYNSVLSDTLTTTTPMIIESPSFEQKELKTDSIKSAKATNWYKNLKKDIYINEGLQILKDMN